MRFRLILGRQDAASDAYVQHLGYVWSGPKFAKIRGGDRTLWTQAFDDDPREGLPPILNCVWLCEHGLHLDRQDSIFGEGT